MPKVIGILELTKWAPLLTVVNSFVLFQRGLDRYSVAHSYFRRKRKAVSCWHTLTADIPLNCKRKRRLRKTELMYVTLLCMLLSVEYEDAPTWLNFHAWLVRVFSRPIFEIFSFWLTQRASCLCFSLSCLLVCLFQPIFFFAHVCSSWPAIVCTSWRYSYFANATTTKLLSYFRNS